MILPAKLELGAPSERSGPMLAYGAAVWALFHSFVVFYEEPHLRRQFPGSYPAYCKRVNRWLPLPPRAGG